jgi:hypothetical protein
LNVRNASVPMCTCAELSKNAILSSLGFLGLTSTAVEGRRTWRKEVREWLIGCDPPRGAS